MMTWFSANMGNIIVVLLLCTVVFLIIRSIVRDRRQGKSSCGSHCGSCPMRGSCHSHAGKKRLRESRFRRV